MILNHLWQSTVFAAAAWLLTLELRNNRAELRYRIWLAASCKFLVPFALLLTIGSRIEWGTAPPAPSQINFVVDQVTRPFPEPEFGPRVGVKEEHSDLPQILFAIWLAGATISAVSWFRQWMRARAVVRSACARGAIAGVPIRSTPERLEPGIFGIFRPVLLVPEGIEQRLTPEQIRAIVAHELAHVRRRDNLTAAIHMLVETIFWFHPVVWMIRWKLAEERERACDEAVLLQSVEPETYAEGILNVCRFYLEPRLACVSGVSGANLKKRIEDIMTARVAHLNLTKRLLIGTATLAAIGGPIVLGLLDAPAIRAQSQKVSFDVASVKLDNNGGQRRFYNFEPGRFRAENLPLVVLISLAYDQPLMNNQITGGPDWVRSALFDIEGKTDLPGLTAKAREKQMKLMLQTLLAERFHLQLRRETKDLPIYALTVGKNGPKLKKADIQEKDCPEGRVDSSSCHVINGGRGRGLHARAADMGDIALFVGNWTDRPLIDKTGLKDLYELDTEGWSDSITRVPRPDGQPSAEDLASADPTRPTLPMILDKLGLKMEAQKGPVDVYIVERAERPTAN